MEKKYKCKYCGKYTANKEMCTNCRSKLEAVRKLMKILEPYKKRGDTE